MTAKQKPLLEDFAIVAIDAHHWRYVDTGALTKGPPDATIGKLLFVQDKDGWATLHRVEGFSYRDGRRLVSFGPRVPWPDGTIAARQTGHIPS